MYEKSEKIVVELQAVDKTTGECFDVTANKLIEKKYYSIKKINTRINDMDFLGVMSIFCKSQKDIIIFRDLIDKIDKYNYVRISNISKYAKELEVSRPKITAFLKKIVDSGFFHKTDSGVYFVNPFVYIGRRVRNNSDRENAQKEWEVLGLEPISENRIENLLRGCK